MILDEILKRTREDLALRKEKLPEDLLGRSLSANPYEPRDVISALRSDEKDPLRIIAEIKKASPSKGIIREDFEPLSLAAEYENAGASAFSVLTEPHYFRGDLEFIAQIRRYTHTPILRKDFIVDRYQILEALVYGADFILLIAKALLEFARRLGLRALCEIHDKDDLKKAVFAGADIIGINHRNLETFEVNTSLSERLIPLIPNGKIIVAESGLHSHEQLLSLHEAGVDAFLIGEHFMRQNDVGAALREIKLGAGG